MSFTDLLTAPDSFFRRRTENPGLLRPLGVVFVAAVAAVLAPLLTYQAYVSAGASALVILTQAGAVIFAFFGQFVAWVILVIVFYLISIAVGGEGSLGDTLKLNGWGFVPAILAGVISAIGQFLALQAVAAPDLPPNPAENPEAFNRAATEFTSSIQSQTAVRVATLLVIVLTIWQAILWVYATKHARNLSLRGAAIAVGIPIGLLVLLSLYNLLTGWVL